MDAERRGWQVAGEFVDKGVSGSKAPVPRRRKEVDLCILRKAKRRKGVFKPEAANSSHRTICAEPPETFPSAI